MKTVKKILYVILGLLLFISIFIVISATNPNISKFVSELLFEDNKEVLAETEMVIGSTPRVSDEDELLKGNELRINDTPDIPETVMDMNSGTEYNPPEKSDVKTPAEVSGRNGYVPVQENSQQVDEEEAEKLQSQITYGETGGDLTFDTTYYPYYGMLDSGTQQKLYRQIYANAMAANADFAPIEPVTQEQLKKVFLAVYNDHPEVFWVDAAYQGTFLRNGNCVEIILQFNQTADNLENSKTAFQSAADEILAGARTLGSDYEKEVYVHDVLLDRVDYNLNAPLNQNAYSALVNKQSVCAGYARAFQYLMRQLNIPCYYSTGYAGENHAWNIIKLDNDYYNVDSTWDDTEPNTYNYFNKPDAEFAGTHVRGDLSVYLPACNGVKYYSDGKRSLAEAGFSEQDVLTNIEDYYTNCYNHIVQSGGSVEFQNVVADEELWLVCYAAYESNTNENSKFYLNRALDELSAESCKISVEAEELRDGRFLLTHNIEVTY